MFELPSLKDASGFDHFAKGPAAGSLVGDVVDLCPELALLKCVTGGSPTQRTQYTLTKEYTLNYKGLNIMV